MTAWIDSHCHLNYDYAPKTEAELVAEAHAEGVTSLVTIGTDLASFATIAAISERHENVFHTVGVHPHEAVTLQDSDLAGIEAAAKHPKCRAIGEIGLDTHYNHSPLDIQRVRLDQQLEIALKLGLPVVIHSREAESEMLDSLTRYTSKLAPGAIPGVIHCFTGTRAFGEACIRLGFYISFSGILTFKKAEDLRECAAAFPLERLLVETDSPYLAPIPFRGKKCEPKMVKMTGLKLAEIKGVPVEEVARITTANSKRLFGIP